MTRIFSRGSNRIEGVVLPATLAVILAISIIMSAWYSLAWVNYVRAKKSLSEYYENLNAHNDEMMTEYQRGETK